MRSISLADAKAHLSELVDKAAQGLSVCITRRGKPVAQLSPIVRPRVPIDFDALKALTDSMPQQTETAGDFMRRLRDASRY